MQVFGLQVVTALAVFPHLYWLIEHNLNRWAARCRPLGADLCARSREVGAGGRPDPEPRIAGWALLAALWLVTRRLRCPAAPQVAADVAPDAARALLLAFGLVLLFVSMMVWSPAPTCSCIGARLICCSWCRRRWSWRAAAPGLGCSPARRAGRLPRGPGRPDAAHGAGGADRRARSRASRTIGAISIRGRWPRPRMRRPCAPWADPSGSRVRGRPPRPARWVCASPERPLVLTGGEPRFSPCAGPTPQPLRRAGAETGAGPARGFRAGGGRVPQPVLARQAPGRQHGASDLMLRSGRHRRSGPVRAAPGAGANGPRRRPRRARASA